MDEAAPRPPDRKIRGGRLALGLGARARTTAPRRITRALRREARAVDAAAALLGPPVDDARPGTRGECREELRPCPYVACKFHLYLDVNPETGSIKINFPDREPWELLDTCALDVADRGGGTLEETGVRFNLTRECVRQIEVRALLKIKMASPSPDEVGAVLLRRPRT